MTESDWTTCRYSYDMLEAVESSASPRKLRLFACGCCRMLWPRLPSESRTLVEVAERHADGKADWAEVMAAIEQAPKGTKFGGSWVSHNPVQIRPYAQAQRTAISLGEVEPFEAAWGAARESMTLLGAAQCDVIRDLFGNPYHIAPDLEAYRQPHVLEIAAGMDLEELPSRHVELAAALAESGCKDAMILEHFKSGTAHFRGCWVVDGILARS